MFLNSRVPAVTHTVYAITEGSRQKRKEYRMELNLTTKFSDKVDERFALKSFTELFTGRNYSFDGAKSIKVYSIDSVPVTDYTREGLTRFGAAGELGDTVQELTLSQDKAFTFIVDNGNSSDELNIKHASQRLRTNWDEVCTPIIDKYRLGIWVNGAGLGKLGTEELTADNVMDAIFEGGAAMSNCLVPTYGRVLFIKHSVYVKVKLSNQIMGIDRLGEDALRNGIVGELDGMKVVAVPDSYFPNGTEFLMKYKNSTVDPMKLKTFRVHKNPPGIDGDLAECRFYYDSFVLSNKINGLYVYATSGMCSAPSITISSSGQATITGTSGETVKYTTDGTDPKTSDSAAVYSSAFTVESGATVKAYSYKTGSINSPVSESTRA